MSHFEGKQNHVLHDFFFLLMDLARVHSVYQLFIRDTINAEVEEVHVTPASAPYAS